jgi:serine/threonine protein kinase
MLSKHEIDPFLDIRLEDYVTTRKLGEGAVGAVYHAQRSDDILNERAIKFIAQDRLKDGWQNEINKVNFLGLTDGVVPYISHNSIIINDMPYIWIAFRYVNSKSLKRLIDTKIMTIPMVCDIVGRALAVLHACKEKGITHGDLHAGNILVEEPNPIYIDQDQQRIWITDFSYLSASLGKDMLDDFAGLGIIIGQCLSVINFHNLDGHDKSIYTALKHEFIRDLQETNPTEGVFVRNPRELLRIFEGFKLPRPEENGKGAKRIGDYLAAEILGERFDEWKAIFVPQFAGSEQLFERNICVLTGLRGCGKTMVFRRLTAIFDFHLGEKIPGSEGFLGFYLNARALAEAYPWLPEDEVENARSQITHYFHVCWVIEILEWLLTIGDPAKTSMEWLLSFFKKFYALDLLVTKSKDMVIHHLISFFSQQQESARLKSKYGRKEWELDRIDFLDLFVDVIQQNIASIADKHFYFFLDDYSTPLVTATTQWILNSVVFRRSARAVFKVATESIESIELVGLNGKVLEQDDDFTLIDSGTESIQRKKEQNREIIRNILKPRIERDPILKERKITIEKILGHTPYKNTELARQLRGENAKQKIRYYGTEVFCDLWTSNTREMITLFAQLVTAGSNDLSREDISEGSPLISADTQNRLLRNAGSRYRDLLVSATDPTKRLCNLPPTDRSYGEHIQKIADAFHEIADSELQSKDSKNQSAKTPKQARRIEITDVSRNLPEDLLPYYRGIIRYGLFLRDWRGKSARGKAVPRLFLRGILIPFYTLTFSKRDSVSMSWDGFCAFLRDPKAFAKDWIEKQKKNNPDTNQTKMPI